MSHHHLPGFHQFPINDEAVEVDTGGEAGAVQANLTEAQLVELEAGHGAAVAGTDAQGGLCGALGQVVADQGASVEGVGDVLAQGGQVGRACTVAAAAGLLAVAVAQAALLQVAVKGVEAVQDGVELGANGGVFGLQFLDLVLQSQVIGSFSLVLIQFLDAPDQHGDNVAGVNAQAGGFHLANPVFFVFGVIPVAHHLGKNLLEVLGYQTQFGAVVLIVFPVEADRAQLADVVQTVG